MIVNTRFNRFKIILLLMVAAVFLSNCGLYDLKKEVAEFETVYGFVGKIIDHSYHKGSVIVILYSDKDDKKKIVEYVLPEDTGHFSFMVTEGIYYLVAFEDLNNNFTYDDGEMTGYFGKPDPIEVRVEQMASSGSKSIKGLNIQLTRTDGFLSGFPKSVRDKKFKGESFAKFGTVANLDDKNFAQKNGTTGYWKPLTFLKNFGVGVYFAQPYDADKIPILFVHGATGTPFGWKKIVNEIDLNQYQPWFYYYPSGLRLDANANVLNYIIKKLHNKYRFDRLYVTAHSMGGLVSRSFIMKNVYEDEQDYIKLFVSISTPWNGHRLSEKGVKQSPAVIPSWHDMVPDSEFIKSIYKQKWPSDLKFYLFFSFRGDCKLMLANNDGTVELSSELDYRAQADAEGMVGFDEEHEGILYSQKFFDYYNQILTSVR